MKSVSKINPAIMENMECSIIEAWASLLSLKVGASLDLYHYALSRR